jgi:nucleoside-diphosphate-sugar epimerase
LNNGKILITGSAGLIGRSVQRRIKALGYEVIGIDLRSFRGSCQVDICEIASHKELLRGVCGVIHLAAVSRVIDAQMDPARCHRVNVEGTRSLLQALKDQPEKPWFIYGSSREVYGEQHSLPVSETAASRPLNVYAESKLAAEILTTEARGSGIASTVVRFSNVFGSANDHETRVVPAFVRRALSEEPLLIEGQHNTFDFTFVEDVSAGVTALAQRLNSGATQLNPIHFVSGRQTSLGDLADIVISITRSNSELVQMPPRTFDVSKFCGCPKYAEMTLGWRATTSLEDGLASLVRDFREYYHDTLCS